MILKWRQSNCWCLTNRVEHWRQWWGVCRKHLLLARRSDRHTCPIRLKFNWIYMSVGDASAHTHTNTHKGPTVLYKKANWCTLHTLHFTPRQVHKSMYITKQELRQTEPLLRNRLSLSPSRNVSPCMEGEGSKQPAEDPISKPADCNPGLSPSNWGLSFFTRLHVRPQNTCFFQTRYLTPSSRVLQKLTGSQLAKKFPAFYGIRKFITAFTTARHPEPDRSSS